MTSHSFGAADRTGGQTKLFDNNNKRSPPFRFKYHALASTPKQREKQLPTSSLYRKAIVEKLRGRYLIVGEWKERNDADPSDNIGDGDLLDGMRWLDHDVSGSTPEECNL